MWMQVSMLAIRRLNINTSPFLMSEFGAKTTFPSFGLFQDWELGRPP